MTIFEFRAAVENAIPWWGPFAFASIALLVFAIAKTKHKQ